MDFWNPRFWHVGSLWMWYSRCEIQKSKKFPHCFFDQKKYFFLDRQNVIWHRFWKNTFWKKTVFFSNSNTNRQSSFKGGPLRADRFRKKKFFFRLHISALRRSFRKNRVCGSIYSSRSIDSRTFFFLRVKIFMSTRSTKTLSLKIHVIFSEFRSFWSRKRNDNGSN